MFLPHQHLAQLTGRQKYTAQRRWLERRGYPYELDADGRPLVLESVVTQRLGNVSSAPTTHEPQLRLP